MSVTVAFFVSLRMSAFMVVPAGVFIFLLAFKSTHQCYKRNTGGGVVCYFKTPFSIISLTEPSLK